MPHARKRIALQSLLKRLKFTPVVAIQGARQTGKSFLAREILSEKLSNILYVTLDDISKRDLAQSSPQTFLASMEGAHTAIIDEAQKAPELFNAIKLAVDKDRRPGRFLLLGSTEFSLLQNIRESLTGRMGRIRLFPMTFAEMNGLDRSNDAVSRASFLRFVESGGMPGIAFTRDLEQRAEFFQDWIDLTCQRDIHQFKRLKLDSELAYEILKNAAIQVEPTAATMARLTRANPKKVATHLKALCELFVLIRLDPHPSGTGKPIYLPLDSGIAGHLGASLTRKLQIALVNERMAKNAYAGGKRHSFYYYRSSGKKIIHLIEIELNGKIRAFQVFDRESVKGPDTELLKAFSRKNPKSELNLLAPVFEGWKFWKVQVRPWEWVFG